MIINYNLVSKLVCFFFQVPRILKSSQQDNVTPTTAEHQKTHAIVIGESKIISFLNMPEEESSDRHGTVTLKREL